MAFKESITACVIVGPTAAGKSAVAIELAGMLGGEIISADSMQVYKGMDIGTAKPGEGERRAVRHHMLDVLRPDESMSVALYCELAKSAYEEISSRGSVPIVAGGTGLYVDAFTRGFLFPDTSADEEFRRSLYAEAEATGPESLHKKLAVVDPEAADRIHKNDTRRIVRALEVYASSGEPISALQKKQASGVGIPSIYYGIGAPREILVERIERRVDEMMRLGLLNEVRHLKDQGFAKSKVAMQAIGYKELLAHLDGSLGFEEAVAKVKAETRKYAKRQMTWFKRYQDITWFDSNTISVSEIARIIARDYTMRVGREGM